MSQQISPMLQSIIENQKKGIKQNDFQPKVDLTQKPDTFELNNKEENKTDSKKKILKIAAIGAAIVAVVAGAIYFIKKGKAPKNLKLEDMTPDKFKQLKADKFTGTVQGKLNLVDEAGKLVEDGKGKGDNIIMEYVDGVLKKSTRSGNVNFEKVYETVNGETFINKTVDGVTSKLNLTELQNNFKANQSKLQEVKNGKLDIRTLEEKEADKEIKRMQDVQDEVIKAFQAPRKSAEESFKVFEQEGAIDKAAIDK